MRWIVLFVAVVGITILAVSGVALALPKYNVPAQYRLKVAGGESITYVVRVIGTDTNDFAVSRSGEVAIDVPRLPRACSLMWFGLTIRDRSPKSLKAIHFLRDGRVVRRLSLRQLEDLPIDHSGAIEVKL